MSFIKSVAISVAVSVSVNGAFAVGRKLKTKYDQRNKKTTATHTPKPDTTTDEYAKERTR
jgi:hypothetical protein